MSRKHFITIKNPEHCGQVQRQLFKKGYMWGSGDTQVICTEVKFLILTDNKTIYYNMDVHNAHSSEIAAGTLTELKLNKRRRVLA